MKRGVSMAKNEMGTKRDVPCLSGRGDSSERSGNAG